jgi:hypothetical protein
MTNFGQHLHNTNNDNNVNNNNAIVLAEAQPNAVDPRLAAVQICVSPLLRNAPPRLQLLAPAVVTCIFGLAREGYLVVKNDAWKTIYQWMLLLLLMAALLSILCYFGGVPTNADEASQMVNAACTVIKWLIPHVLHFMQAFDNKAQLAVHAC